MGGNRSGRYRLKRIMRNIAVFTAYTFFAGAGAFAFFSPSLALAQQGGAVIVYAYAVLCVLGASLGLVGITLRSTITELAGVVAVITASLTWALSVIFQAFATDNPSFGVAACMGCALAGMVLQRWLDASRSPRR